MFRKFIITVICCLSIFALSAVPSYAAGFGGGQRGGGFSSSGFSSNTISTYLSYDALSDLCVEVNYNLERNVYSSDGFPSSGKYAATIVSRSDGYYIGVYNAGSYTWFRNPSGGFYICKYDADSLLSSIFSKVSSISSNVDSLATNITQLMASNGYLASINNKLASMESSLTRLLSRTLKTDQDGIQYTLAELVYNLWQKTDRIYDRTLKTVGSAQYTISDLQYNTWQQTERAASRLLKTVDNATYTVADLQYNTWQQAKNAVTKLSSIDTRLSTLHTDAASVISAIKALPDYSDKLDTITELLTTNTYTCGYSTDAGGTAYKTIPISYDSAEAIVARLNTQLPGKRITYLPREGAPEPLDFDYCALDSTMFIRVYSGQYSYFLCDSGNRLYRASIDRVNVIDDRLVGINNILVSLGQKLDKLPTSYPLPDLTTIESTLSNLDSNISQLHTDNIGFVGVINTMNNTLGDLNFKLGDLKTSLGGLEVNITGGSSGSADLTKVESALSTIIDKMDNLPASVDNIVVNITKDNDAYNVFYVEDENGDKKSVTSVAGDSLSASGKLLQFLYKLIVGSAISDVDSSINGLNDFFFDNAPSGLGEGVTVWD